MFRRAGSQVWLLHLTGKKTSSQEPWSHQAPATPRSFPTFPLLLNQSIPRTAGGAQQSPRDTRVVPTGANTSGHRGRDDGDAQRQPGLTQLRSTPTSEKRCQCHLSPHRHRPTAPRGVSLGNPYSSKHRFRCKFNNSALGRRHPGLCSSGGHREISSHPLPYNAPLKINFSTISRPACCSGQCTD